MSARIICSVLLALCFCVAQVFSNGLSCDNNNYRVFVLHTDPTNIWTGTLNEAKTMCEMAGHDLAKDTICIEKLLDNITAVYASQAGAPKEVWIDQELKPDNESQCAIYNANDKKMKFIKCANSLPAVCQGFSTRDFQMAEAYPGREMPFSIEFGATSAPSKKKEGVDYYYYLCGILGVVLIGIVVSAAIWRSGYVNNRYSFRRLPASAAAGNPTTTPKSHTVTSQMGSEVPHGYVKASVTKETIA